MSREELLGKTLIESAVVMMVMATVTPFDEGENENDDDNDNDVEDAWEEKNFGGTISCGDNDAFGCGFICDENDDDNDNDAERMNGGRRGMVRG